MYQDKIVTIFFIKRMPKYVFRQLYCHHKGQYDDGNIIAEIRIGAFF
jgi:hypothetical protein